MQKQHIYNIDKIRLIYMYGIYGSVYFGTVLCVVFFFVLFPHVRSISSNVKCAPYPCHKLLYVLISILRIQTLTILFNYLDF